MSAIGNAFVASGKMIPLGYQRIALTAVSKLTVPPGAKIADIDAEAQNVRWTDDGTVPTTGAGKRLLADTERRFSTSLAALQFISETAGAIINITYYG